VGRKIDPVGVLQINHDLHQRQRIDKPRCNQAFALANLFDGPVRFLDGAQKLCKVLKPPLPVAGIMVRALRERLSDPDADVVRLACALFAILPEKAAAPAIPRLGKLLVNRTPSIRLAAVRALRCLGARDRETLGMYVCSLAIDDAELRHAVGVALCEAGGGAIPLLVAALADDDPNAKIGAAIVLGRFGPGAASAVAALTALLEDSREAVRSAASKALERIRAE